MNKTPRLAGQWHCLAKSVTCGLLLLAGSASALTLQRDDMIFTVDPSTLAIRIGNMPVNQPQAPEKVTALSHGPTQASWHWPQRAMNVALRLGENELYLDFTTAKPQRFTWFSLPEPVETLLLPLAEGSRVSLKDPHWQQYLLGEMSSLNTNMDLKLPLWSQLQGGQVVSWLLLTPMHNEVAFSGAETAVKMVAAHEFNRFNQHQPLQILLYAGRSELSGALRYRQYLQQTGQFTSLQDKIRLAPEGEKLIGATHVYLWGNGPLDVSDVIDWPGLALYLQSPGGLSLWDKIDKEGRQTLETVKTRIPQPWQQASLTAALNAALIDSVPVNATPDDPDFLPAQQAQANAIRRLAEQRLGPFLAPAAAWGQGLSTPLITALHQAGLPRLWLATEKWTANFMAARAVALAKKSGYLIATYDSYDTAIPRGVNDSWLSAQIPAALRENCAIVEAHGGKKPGFGQKGYYLNPSCMLSFSQRRISELMHLGNLNSLFLDVDGTGMAADDYHPVHPSGAQHTIAARNARMAWFNTTFKLPLGSEDGNAANAGQLMFAHGTQTWGFGWGRKDMYQDRRSPWYLGAWWPDAQPAFFFAPAKVKEPYRSVVFDPRNRIPLYQAVFHDALISSHHWHTDNLKLSEVKTTRTLLSGLYNTAPMYHLNRATLAARLPEILKTDAVFRPLHTALWNQALTGFRWLDDAGWVQQTTFSDGSVIVANFSQSAFADIPAQGLRATLADGRILDFKG
ncbi:glycoside hydrolase [Sodalis sp. RH22]|uniref:glycoside hydrolase n=1 Tax=unclassified Sodalis (in: enterobacteria) TaxID=2636512 RepID=UPI0039B485AC